MSRIGFVGLGHMGFPMAVNLIKAGHEVTGFDLNQEAMTAWVKAGGAPAANIAEVVKDQEIVITMLQTGQQVKQVALGAEGVLHRLHPGALLIDCSTIDVQSAREVHEQAEHLRIACVDAPVSGGVAGAAAGTLTFMVGGSSDAFNKAHPILSCMGKKIIHTGATGSGQAAKICNNMILGISMTAISEAFILAERLGLSAKKLHEVVSNASGQCWSMTQYVPVPGILEQVPANQDYKPGFAAAMMLKDLVLSQNSAHSVHLDTPLGAQATALYQQFVEEGHGDKDFSAIIQLLAHGEEASHENL